ncbi:MAG: hypothetical protein ACRDDY_05125 [Clostridium sp.]|uniref:hypothetical protein n=1 Tax=Clostridium sp. TaxID=1506 RepID=UPI003EE713DC
MNNKTETFENELSSINSDSELSTLLSKLDKHDITFAEFLISVCLQKNIDKKILLNEADLSRSYYYEIINGKKIPNRDTVLKIAFVLSFTREETDKALKLTFNGALYPKNTRDATIIFCLNKGYTLLQTDYILYDHNLKTLTRE